MDQRLPFSVQRAVTRAMRRGLLSVTALGNPILDSIVVADRDQRLPAGLEWGRAVHLDSGAVDAAARKLPAGSQCAGGGAANTLAALAAFGACCRLIGATGDDPPADSYRQDLERHSVIDALQSVHRATGRCLVVSASGAGQLRAIAAAPGAAAGLQPAHVERELAPQPGRLAGDLLFIEGYLLDRPSIVETALAAALSPQAAPLIVLSLAHTAIVAARRDEIAQKYLQSIDILFANEQEFRVFVQLADDMPLESHALAPWGARLPLTVVTRGDAGASVLWAGGAVHQPAAPGAGAAVTDSTGAGDIFAGAFLAALFAGAPLETALQIGNGAAAVSLTVCGGRIPAAALERLRAMIPAG